MQQGFPKTYLLRTSALIFCLLLSMGCLGELDEIQRTGAGINAPCEGERVADSVIAGPEGDLSGAINGVLGGGAGEGSEDVASLKLRDGADTLILRWAGCRITNGVGADFVVFENGFVIGDGPGVFMDPLIVSVSRDGDTWVTFPHDYLAEDELRYSNLPEHWQGFAGVGPVLWNDDTSTGSPFDAVSAGGDHFDLDHLPDEPEALMIKSEGFRFLRLVTAPTQNNPDSGARYPREPISDGADIDGVYGRYLVDDDL